MLGDVFDNEVKSYGAAASSVGELRCRLGWSQGVLPTSSGLYESVWSCVIHRLSLCPRVSLNRPVG